MHPEKLANMLHKDALQCKLDGVSKKYDEAVEVVFKYYADGGVAYTTISEQNYWLDYLDKARKLTELQIAELNPNYEGD